MFLTQATNAGAKVVQLNTELIQVIEKIKSELQGSGQDLSWGQILVELYRNRDSESVHKDIISAVLSELNIPLDKINSRLTKLQGYLVDLQNRLEPLVQDLGTPGELLNADVDFTPEDKQLAVGEVAFVIGGSASAGINISSYNASSLPDDWEGNVSESSGLQELSLAGKLAFTGTGSGAFGSASLTLSASMSKSGSLRLYHEYNAKTARIAALVMSANNFAMPWDLEGLQKQLQKPEDNGEVRGFRRMHVHGQGDINFAAGVDVGYAYQYETDVPTPDGDQPLGIQAGLQAGLNVGFKRSGAFKYVIDKDINDNLLISVERNASSSSSLAFNIDADLVITGLDQVAASYVKSFFKDPQSLLTKLEAWTKPGDLLVKEFKARDWKNDAVEQVGLLLLGETDARTLSQTAIGKLESLLSQTLNEKIPFWGEDSSQITEQLLTLVSQRLDLGSELSSALREAVADKLTTRLDKVRQGLEAELKTILKNTEDVATEILDPLEHVGIKVQQLREAANVTAGKLLDPAIQYLKRYQDLRDKVLQALQQVANFKIGLSIAASLNRERSQQTLLGFRIVTINKTTSAVHRAFILGRLHQAWDEFEQARNEGWIDQITGVFSAQAKRERKIGFSLHFGDFGGIDRTRVLSEQVHIQVDPAGNILAATTQLSQEALVEAFHVRRSIGLISSYDLAAASRDQAQMPSPLAFNLSYKDKILRKSEMREFLLSLEQIRGRRSLIPVGAADAAVNSYLELRQQHGLSKAGGRIDIALPVTLADLTKLLTVDNKVILDQAIDIQADLLLRDSDQRGMLSSFASRYKGGMSKTEFILAVNGKSPSTIASELNLNAPTGRLTPLDLFTKRLKSIVDNAEALVEVVDGIRDIAALRKRLQNLPANPAPSIAEQLEKELSNASEQINEGLARWLKVTGTITGLFDEAIPEQTIAFLSLLSELSPDDTQLVPIVKIDGIEDGTILVA